MTQQLAVEYADAIARELWELDDTGGIFPHECECDDHAREECEQCPICQEELGAYGYLASALDIEYRASPDGEYRSAKILVAYGGPSAWVDTGARELIVSWDERVSRSIPRGFCRQLDDALEEIWESR